MTTHTPEQPDDAALERLRAADPAAGLDPDTEAPEAAGRTRLPAAFAGATATPGAPASPPADTGVPSGAPVDELAERRARRRRRAPLQVAAAVAGVLVVGAGGYALGAGAVGASPAGDTSELT